MAEDSDLDEKDNEDDDGQDHEDEELRRKLLDTTAFRGALGTFPHGQLSKADEGAIQFGVTAKDGKVVWQTKNGDPKLGAVNTNAPHVFKDKVITGISGGVFVDGKPMQATEISGPGGQPLPAVVQVHLVKPDAT